MKTSFSNSHSRASPESTHQPISSSSKCHQPTDLSSKTTHAWTLNLLPISSSQPTILFLPLPNSFPSFSPPFQTKTQTTEPKNVFPPSLYRSSLLSLLPFRRPVFIPSTRTEKLFPRTPPAKHLLRKRKHNPNNTLCTKREQTWGHKSAKQVLQAQSQAANRVHTSFTLMLFLETSQKVEMR